MATTPPQKVNAGGRTVTSMTVLNADDPNVEREDLNRKLKKLQDLSAGTKGERGIQGVPGQAADPGELATALQYSIGSDSDIVVVGDAGVSWRMPFPMSLYYIRGSIASVSTSGDVEVDITADGVSLFGANNLLIEEGVLSSFLSSPQPDYDTSVIADDALINTEVVNAGTDATGLKLYLVGRRII